MGGIQGIGGPLEPVNPNNANGRSRRPENRPAAKAADDTVHVSPEAADLAKLSSIASEVDTHRAERIAQAQENLQNGTYKVQEVLEVVASRISRYIENE
jgi:anti-sigma28 factor (negative regulator of flagellin synthesis)